MNDRELLELAAKAAGLHIGSDQGDYQYRDGGTWVAGLYATDNGYSLFWNPLIDDRDALRLAVKLRLDIEHGCELDNDRYVYVSRHGIELVRDPVGCWEEIEDEDHRAAATCRAITRAAAEIGARITTEDGK